MPSNNQIQETRNFINSYINTGSKIQRILNLQPDPIVELQSLSIALWDHLERGAADEHRRIVLAAHFNDGADRVLFDFMFLFLCDYYLFKFISLSLSLSLVNSIFILCLIYIPNLSTSFWGASKSCFLNFSTLKLDHHRRMNS